ncbi:outer membrane beta-barrel protein [Mucilaginibacter sp. Bleaf8]|uniref:outer membrane beta-barrel protein n=1 Tax=Mucilaginibacter sp. Bleaf8 TaxID=2834430 RepID=UPI001BCEB3D6|nr:outer membrane beta-barrel protein [Mucilaginibacter sp. Bleaf8]MBS7564162.1 outer membrane beta-barrel protein [Mucilaginibacter sp. Bleaf8]
MKRLLFTALLSAAATGMFAQTVTKTTTSTTVVTNDKGDTLQVRTDTVKTKRKGFKFTFGQGGDATSVSVNRRDTVETVSKAPGFSWGITFSRFDLGLTTLIDNGSFSLSPQNNFLRYRSWKSSNVGFDVIQAGYRFNSYFRIYASAGFDWTHIRLRENITILEDQPVLTYRQDDIIYSKNRFTSSYLRIPLTFDWRSAENNNGKRFHLAGGPDIGILLNGRVKQKSDENGKEKFNDDFHFAKVRYGVFARVGYGFTGLFAKYYFNDMFDNSPAQKGLKNLSFGLTFGF